MSIANVADKSITDKIDTIRIHDTIFSRDTLVIVDKTSQELMTNVQTFYSDNFSHLLGLFALCVALATAFIGWFLPEWQKKKYRKRAENLKNQINKHEDHINTIEDTFDDIKEKFNDIELQINIFETSMKIHKELIDNSIDELTKKSSDINIKLDSQKSDFENKFETTRRGLFHSMASYLTMMGIDYLQRGIDALKPVSISLLIRGLTFSIMDKELFIKHYNLIMNYCQPNSYFHKLFDDSDSDELVKTIQNDLNDILLIDTSDEIKHKIDTLKKHIFNNLST